MKLSIFALAFFIVIHLACAQEQVHPVVSGGPGVSPFLPVNPLSRFLLSDAVPLLAGSLPDSSGALVLREGEYRRVDNAILTQVPQAQGKSSAWVQMSSYWIEPVTPPPSLGEPLIVPIDDMRLAEVQGEVTLTPATESGAKAKSMEANEDMEVSDGDTINTGATGSAAVLVGGHSSVRLVPNSHVQFLYNTSTPTPRLELRIVDGSVFCKIGQFSSGRAPDVGIRGPIGAVATIGSSDFLVQSDPVSLHLCLVQGKLLVGDGIPLAVGNMNWYPPDAEADNRTGPALCHWPAPASPEKKKTLDASVLDFALHQIEALNTQTKALLHSAAPLSSDDQAYLDRIPRIIWFARATAAP